MSLNEKLQKLRKENKYSQEELADKLGVTRQSISKWESGITYPEMDKLLSLSKIFNCSLEELTNDDIKVDDFGGTKKSNFNSIIDSILDIINRTYHFFAHIKFKDLIKCLLVMIFVGLLLSLMHNPVISLENSIYAMFNSFDKPAIANFFYNLFRIILEFAYYVLYILLFGYIFKIAFLDKKEKIQEDMNSNVSEIKSEGISKKSKHHDYTIFDTLASIVMFLIKIALGFFCIPFICLLVFLCFCLAICVYVLFKGLFYFSVLLGLVASIALVSLVIELIINIIFNRKNDHKRMLITFLCSLASIGLAGGLFAIDVNNITYIDKAPANMKTIETNYTYQYNKDLKVNSYYNVTYVVDNSLKDSVIVSLKSYANFTNATASLDNNYILINSSTDKFKLDNYTNLIINDLKKNNLHDYYKLSDVNVIIKTSEANINNIKNNMVAEDALYDDCNNEMDDLQHKNDELNEKVNELESENQSLKDKINDYKDRIKSLLD